MKVLDQPTLDSLRELDADTGGDLLHQLIEAYNLEIPDRVENLGKLIKARDQAKVVFEAHGIKSTFANFGGLHAADLLGQIEGAAKIANWPVVDSLVSPLGPAVADFENDLALLQAEVDAKKST